MNENILNEISEIYEKSKKCGICDEDFIEHIKSQFAYLPTKDGWTIIEEKLKEVELDCMERHPKPWGYEFTGYHLSDEGPRFVISIKDGEPFGCTICLRESYYYPLENFVLDLDCASRYVSWDYFIEGLNSNNIKTFEDYEKLSKEKIISMINDSIASNENWEPSEIDCKKGKFSTTDELWNFLQTTIKSMVAEYKELEGFEIHGEDYIEDANDIAYKYFIKGKKPQNKSMYFIEEDLCCDE